MEGKEESMSDGNEARKRRWEMKISEDKEEELYKENEEEDAEVNKKGKEREQKKMKNGEK